MPGEIPNYYEMIRELQKMLARQQVRYEEVLYDWLDCDFTNISDIEEMKYRTRVLLNDSAE